MNHIDWIIQNYRRTIPHNITNQLRQMCFHRNRVKCNRRKFDQIVVVVVVIAAFAVCLNERAHTQHTLVIHSYLLIPSSMLDQNMTANTTTK